MSNLDRLACLCQDSSPECGEGSGRVEVREMLLKVRDDLQKEIARLRENTQGCTGAMQKMNDEWIERLSKNLKEVEERLAYLDSQSGEVNPQE